MPPRFAEGGRRYRYGRSDMQIHFALSEPARWEGDERLGKTAIVHLTPGLDGVSRAVNEAERGLLPAEATVVVGQPLTMDPTRAPEGAGLLWIQLQELPWRVKGDAADELDVGDGTWTEELRERYADRIQARIARHVPNLESSLRKRVVLSPADLQAANVNLHRGDPYSGSLALDQNFLWRPFAESPGHATPVDRLWHIGASTHPGPGLGAGSGTLVAKQLLEPPLRARAFARARTLVGPMTPRFSISQITTVGAVVRRRPRRLPRRGRARDRDLGDEARRRLLRLASARAGSRRRPPSRRCRRSCRCR